MVMRDGDALDVGPGGDPVRAAPQHHGAYHTTAFFLTLYATALTAWTVYGIAQGDGSVWDFVEGLFNPGASPASQLVGPYEWAFAAAFLATAGLAVAHRRPARSAALFSGFFLLAVSLREAVGLCDAAYRDQYATDPLGGWALATRVLGLVVAVVVLTTMLPATETRPRRLTRSDPPAPRPVPGARDRRLSRICGVLFLAMGVTRLGWTVHDLTLTGMDTFRYLRGAVDGSVLGTLNLAASTEFTTLGSVLGFFLLGWLAFRARRDLRGALLVFASVELYLTVRTVVWLTVTDFFNQSFETPQGALSMATTAFGLAAMTSVLVLVMGWRSERESPTAESTT
ncbi:MULTISPECIES: hypothetical protein [Streptomyces]|uniref:Exosortase/archaeosortase family protein n=1 Tax=Streptomyces yunnanensis TaxID=156453 RepID=A0ABY8A9N1_9ACTN|nr:MULTISPECIES: hypothetical protein [Streptomyces]AJC56524.1 hypothetical protein GZL_03938 [Streptomyces sp. 769]WEB40904.1 hypothetical protein MOV08_17535 [Streptomyces yunnanensis]